MTGSELRHALIELRLKQTDFAKMLEHRDSTISDWVTDKSPVPRPIELLVAKMLAEQANA